MDWKEVGLKVARLGAPLLGGVVGGPMGAKLGTVLAAAMGSEDQPDAVARAIDADPQAAARVIEIQASLQAELAQLRTQEAMQESHERVQQLSQVNQTMRAESTSKHWPQWAWRPFNGFLFGITLFSVYFVLPLAEKDIPDIPEWVWMSWAAVLGVTAWHRGARQRAEVGDFSQPMNILNRK